MATKLQAAASIFSIVGLLSAFIGWAIYRAQRDMKFEPLEREVIKVPYLKVDAMLKNGEGWAIAPEEDYNRDRGTVYLERFKPKELMPPE